MTFQVNRTKLFLFNDTAEWADGVFYIWSHIDEQT